MKKGLVVLVVLLCLCILICSLSDTCMKRLTAWRFSSGSLIGSDRYVYGDLYGMSFLPGFKYKNEYAADGLLKGSCGDARRMNLYIAGDSYLGDQYIKGPELFCGVKQVYYVKVNGKEPQRFQPEKGVINILLIEMVERELRFYRDTNFVMGKALVEHSVPTTPKSFWEELNSSQYNPNVEQNLEFNLFDYRLFTPLKEWKAQLNDRVFNRVNADVVKAPDNRMLLYQSTVDSVSVKSSFSALSDAEVDELVYSLNSIYLHYKKAGFDQIYLSVIPNPVTVNYPVAGTYNRLIPRVQEHDSLKMPVLDVYTTFRSVNENLYFQSDTHWNMRGFSLWLELFNERMGKDYRDCKR